MSSAGLGIRPSGGEGVVGSSGERQVRCWVLDTKSAGFRPHANTTRLMGRLAQVGGVGGSPAHTADHEFGNMLCVMS